jgi:hypothetical protein
MRIVDEMYEGVVDCSPEDIMALVSALPRSDYVQDLGTSHAKEGLKLPIREIRSLRRCDKGSAQDLPLLGS